MNVVDGLLVGALVVFALVGWHRGFISGLLSFVGFLGGGLIAAIVLPRIVDASSMSMVARSVIIGVGILSACFAGQLLTGMFGDRLRDSMSWTPVRMVDHLGGVALNLLVLAVLTWMVVSIAMFLPSTSITEQLRESKLAGAFAAMVPDQAQRVFTGIQGVLSTTSVPDLFSGMVGLAGPEVKAPDESALTSASRGAAASVVKVTGVADECDSQVSGSGFVIGPGSVLTNAHVVAGLTEVIVHTDTDVAGLSGRVVYFDPIGDVAIVRIPGLRFKPLRFGTQPAVSGDPALVAGYPHSGSLVLTPVRVRTQIQARTADIYGTTSANRTVYIVRGPVQRGDSGGPLLDRTGAVLGMAFGSNPDEASNGFVIANDELRKIAALASSFVDAVDTGDCHIRE